MFSFNTSTRQSLKIVLALAVGFSIGNSYSGYSVLFSSQDLCLGRPRDWTVPPPLAENKLPPPNVNTEDPFPPISCNALVQRFEQGHLQDPNEGIIHKRYTIDDPQFWVSLHKKPYDGVRWSIMQYGFYYERQLSKIIAKIVRSESKRNTAESKFKKPLMIDVGGNIGCHSLNAAAAGAQVYIFEPNHANILRICQSVSLNGWNNHTDEADRLQIFPFGVSNKPGKAKLGVTYDKSREAKFAPPLWDPVSQVFRDKRSNSTLGGNPGEWALKEVSNGDGTNDEDVFRLVTLDLIGSHLGWFDSDVAVLKVDVEGSELNVFLGAKELLYAQRIKNIFFEGNFQNEEKISMFKEIIQLLLEAGYGVHRIGGYMGPTDELNISLPTQSEAWANYTDNLISACRGESKRAQCNLWVTKRSDDLIETIQ